MIDDEKTLLKLYWDLHQSNMVQGRHHEAQRSTVASVLIAISGAIVGLVTFDKNISNWDAPLTILLLGIGLFGVTFSYKQYERVTKHMSRAQAYLDTMDELLCEYPICRIKEKSDKVHGHKFPTFSRLRINYFWTALYSMVSLLGAALTITALCS